MTPPPRGARIIAHTGAPIPEGVGALLCVLIDGDVGL